MALKIEAAGFQKKTGHVYYPSCAQLGETLQLRVWKLIIYRLYTAHEMLKVFASLTTSSIICTKLGQLVKYRPNIAEISTKHWSNIDQKLVIYRPNNGQISTKYWSNIAGTCRNILPTRESHFLPAPWFTPIPSSTLDCHQCSVKQKSKITKRSVPRPPLQNI